ncbi:MAG: Rha family transcriptional regulator [Paludibacter sp.]|nr:Rha family transcriptional regulator [Paludibacter sp.]
MSSNQNELVSYSNDQLVTNSLLVAQKFNKKHFHVLNAVKNLINSHEKSCQLFVSTSYIDESGKANQLYIMNRDGFSLLVMGFTGKDALNFKLEFIEAFNKMEKQIKEAVKPLSSAEMFLQNAQLMVEHDKRIASVESKLHVLEAKTTTRIEEFTIAGYATLLGLHVNLVQASKFGRLAKNMCKNSNIVPGTIPDPRFGNVHTYPEQILKVVFQNPIN